MIEPSHKHTREVEVEELNGRHIAGAIAADHPMPSTAPFVSR